MFLCVGFIWIEDSVRACGGYLYDQDRRTGEGISLMQEEWLLVWERGEG